MTQRYELHACIYIALFGMICWKTHSFFFLSFFAFLSEMADEIQIPKSFEVGMLEALLRSAYFETLLICCETPLIFCLKSFLLIYHGVWREEFVMRHQVDITLTSDLINSS